MNRPVDIVVTGFVKNADLCVESFATPRRLRQEGRVRAIRYVTWDSPDLDPHVAPVAAMGDVEITRVAAPVPDGNFKQKGVVYQVRNLEAALALVPGDDTLVVKTRPDLVFAADFLRRKIADFERLCRIDVDASAFGVKLRRAPFFRKIWIPWADANQPFFYEDAAFGGLKRDLARLVTPDVGARLEVMADLDCGPFAHVVRYGAIFLDRFPIFARYLANYGAFINDLEYRKGLLLFALNDPFFWHLIVANAWILYSGFHIDAGLAGDIAFYANNVNPGRQGAALNNAAPYDDVAAWRANARAGLDVFTGVGRRYGRLVDDAWPRALFTQRMADIPAETIKGVAQSLADYGHGALREVEDAYYAKLAAYRRDNWPVPVPVAALTVAPPKFAA
ncbi:MAG: hypothetical protein WDN08_02265 [Rhizomicrobium sp.]